MVAAGKAIVDVSAEKDTNVRVDEIGTSFISILPTSYSKHTDMTNTKAASDRMEMIESSANVIRSEIGMSVQSFYPFLE